MQSKIKKAIFPIAGLGSRFLPATKTLAKEMLIVMDRPILEWAVIEASRSGIEEMIFVTSSKKNSIIEHFNRSLELENLLKKKKKNNQISSIQSQSKLGKFTYVIQDEPKGLGHAVWCAKRFIEKNENFVVMLPDDATLNDHLGDAYWMSNRKSEALSQWKKVLVIDPDYKDKNLVHKKINKGL